MNGFNLSDAIDIRLGSTSVSAVYLGSTLIWPTSQHDYSLDYLTFEVLEPTTFTFSDNNLQYSLDNGSTWMTLTADTATPTVSAGDKILWKQTGLTPNNGIGKFSATGNFKVYGNIMSLYYGDNFIGQTDLTGKLFAFEYLFNNNTKLVDAGNLILPATTLAHMCYGYMFKGCTSLIAAPELPATTLADHCYDGMFWDCTSLTTAPELSATTLASGCYLNMFNSCTSLTTAPELPATTLYTYCYQDMFFDCTSLNYIKCLATDISASGCLLNWVYNVAATGTFVRDVNMESWSIGVNGIPTGWTVIPPMEHDYSQDYLTFEALESTTFTFPTNDLQYSLDNGATWTLLILGDASPTVSAGNKILWKQTGLTPVSTNSQGIGTFSATGNFNVYGNIMSLYYGDNFVGQTDLTGKKYAFSRLFYQNDKLVDAENLILPATTLTQSCYAQMFYNCTSLTTAPKIFSGTTLANLCCNNMFYGCTSLTKAPEILPATTLVQNCYKNMFRGCTLLTTAPELPATTLANNCYQYMFNGCTSLNYIKCLATDISASSCTSNWVYNVAATGTFVKPASTDWSGKTGNNGIPSGWTVQDI